MKLKWNDRMLFACVLLMVTACQTQLIPAPSEKPIEIATEVPQTSITTHPNGGADSAAIETQNDMDIEKATEVPVYTAIPVHTAVVGTPVEGSTFEPPITECERYAALIWQIIEENGGTVVGGGGGGNDKECFMSFEGLKNIEDITVIYGAANKIFLEDNWVEDIQMAAGGPTGAVVGYRKEDKVCIFQYEWQIPKDERCPTDKPVASCDIPQKDKVYLISLACHQVDMKEITPTPLILGATQSP